MNYGTCYIPRRIIVLDYGTVIMSDRGNEMAQLLVTLRCKSKVAGSIPGVIIVIFR